MMLVMCSLSFCQRMSLDDILHKFECNLLNLLYPVNHCGLRHSELLGDFAA